MTREPYSLGYDITRDYVDRLERINGLADGKIKDPHLTKLDNVAWWMVAILFAGWVIGNL